MVPKKVYIGNDFFKTAVASAVIAYNDGAQGLPPVFNMLGVDNGYFTKEGLRKSDIQPVKQSDKKSTKQVKHRQKKLLGIRKGLNDKNEVEGRRDMLVEHFSLIFEFYCFILFYLFFL